MLARHPDVRHAAVIVREEAPGERQLVAYVVLGSQASVSGRDLREYVAALLPEYMVPRAVVVIEAFPLTPHGKIDRLALPAPRLAGGSDSGTPYASETEHLVARIWEEVLGVSSVSRDADFLDLGGHSLSAMRVASRLQQGTGVTVSALEVFETVTVAGLASWLDQERQSSSAVHDLVSERSSHPV